jgi:6-phosphogluconate dehydrogenase
MKKHLSGDSTLSQIGLIGLATMGQNLALNFATKGHSISVFNRTPNVTEEFFSKRAEKFAIRPCFSIADFVQSLERPRRIILMVKAGAPVDATLAQLVPLLTKDDIIIDGGNSFFRDTNRRIISLHESKLVFMGMGVSGGEYGALHGPSIMLGGDKQHTTALLPLLKTIAAQTPSPCAAWVGNSSAGHYVKMIHNGIEYAEMQLIAEISAFARAIFGLGHEELASLFTSLQKSELSSYLNEITIEILQKKDDLTKNPLVDMIVDSVENKGTGKWMAQEALELGRPVPTITAAINARYLSTFKLERIETATLFAKAKLPPPVKTNLESVALIRGALLCAKIITFAQGFDLLTHASMEYKYNTDPTTVANIWRNGCILRSKFLDHISEAYSTHSPTNLMHSLWFQSLLKHNLTHLRNFVSLSSLSGIGIPAFSSALAYFEQFTCANSPANLIQAQRDYFGAHTYNRIDRKGTFHTRWEE